MDGKFTNGTFPDESMSQEACRRRARVIRYHLGVGRDEEFG